MKRIIKKDFSRKSLDQLFADAINKNPDLLPDNYLDFAMKYLNNDPKNFIESRISMPAQPREGLGFIMPYTCYNINIEDAMLKTLAITIDLLGANGIATLITVMMGIPDQVIREIEFSNGELCCLKLGYELSEFSELDILSGLNGIYCQYAHDCNCNKSERCQIRINEIISNLDSLKEKRAMKRDNGKWIARP